ncbi:hypothetical protein SDC9_198043 [bioreactor metagenome]|uniref:Uncharacterized protein n=2 Tax=root TaxID=1 RepID=A0A645IGK0_9ZZZZ
MNEQEDLNMEVNVESTENQIAEINEGDLITFYNYEEK